MRNHNRVSGGGLATGFWAVIMIAVISGLVSLACSSTETTTTSSSPTAAPVAKSTSASPIAATEAPATTNVAKETKNPLKDQVAAAAAGKPLYAANCAACHGDAGKGDGPAGTALDPKPTDLTRGDVPGDPDGELFLAIKNGKMKNGKVTMPPAKKLDDQQIWQVVAYVRTLAKK